MKNKGICNPKFVRIALSFDKKPAIADTFVLATGSTSSVREFLQMSFDTAEIDVQFQGKGLDEICIDKKSGKKLVKINPTYYRPAEVDLLIGDNSKAKKELKWIPKTNLKELNKLMFENDYNSCKKNI